MGRADIRRDARHRSSSVALDTFELVVFVKKAEMFGRAVTLIGLSVVSVASATQYGYNHVPTQKNTDLVAANFKDVDIDLYSPAFLNPDKIQAGFSEGTQGATSQDDFGQYLAYLSDLLD
jgi:hypothetical protein